MCLMCCALNTLLGTLDPDERRTPVMTPMAMQNMQPKQRPVKEAQQQHAPQMFRLFSRKCFNLLAAPMESPTSTVG